MKDILDIISVNRKIKSNKKLIDSESVVNNKNTLSNFIEKAEVEIYKDNQNACIAIDLILKLKDNLFLSFILYMFTIMSINVYFFTIGISDYTIYALISSISCFTILFVMFVLSECLSIKDSFNLIFNKSKNIKISHIILFTGCFLLIALFYFMSIVIEDANTIAMLKSNSSYLDNEAFANINLIIFPLFVALILLFFIGSGFISFYDVLIMSIGLLFFNYVFGFLGSATTDIVSMWITSTTVTISIIIIYSLLSSYLNKVEHRLKLFIEQRDKVNNDFEKYKNKNQETILKKINFLYFQQMANSIRYWNDDIDYGSTNILGEFKDKVVLDMYLEDFEEEPTQKQLVAWIKENKKAPLDKIKRYMQYYQKHYSKKGDKDIFELKYFIDFLEIIAFRDSDEFDKIIEKDFKIENKENLSYERLKLIQKYY